METMLKSGDGVFCGERVRPRILAELSACVFGPVGLRDG